MQAIYERNGRFIKDLTSPDGETTDHKSVNKAKKAPRKLQETNGGLGRGSLIVKKR